jgi:hypothetical protein
MPASNLTTTHTATTCLPSWAAAPRVSQSISQSVRLCLRGSGGCVGADRWLWLLSMAGGLSKAPAA